MGAKKEGDVAASVFKMDMHCEGCAKKVQKSAMRLNGVESAKVDLAGGKLTVIGKVDPMTVKNQVELGTKIKVEIVSPPKKSKDSDSGASKEDSRKGPDKKSNDDGKLPTKEKENTVVLKIMLHCQHCVSKAKKTLNDISGVKSVSINESNNQITVKGTVNENVLASQLASKLHKKVDVVPSKKDDGKKPDKTSGEKGEDGCSGDKKGEKKPKESNDGEKKKESDPKTDKKQRDGTKKEDAARLEVGRMECYGHAPAPAPPCYWMPGGYAQNYHVNPEQHPGYYGMPPAMYPNQMQPPDQMFSDENPNACSIM